jgi:hypothetical protein
MNEYKIYKLIFPNGKVYIGQTKQEIQKRWGFQGKGYKNCPKVYNAILKYGWENVKKEILYDKLNHNDANMLEIKLITEVYNSNNNNFGYNIENGGNTIGTHSEETKRKIGEGNKGKIVSLETREKIRQAKLGKKASNEAKEKLKNICKMSNMKRNQHLIFFNEKMYNLKELSELLNVKYATLRMYISKYSKILGEQEAINKMIKYYGEKYDKSSEK